jgi:hypothetical protein
MATPEKKVNDLAAESPTDRRWVMKALKGLSSPAVLCMETRRLCMAKYRRIKP